MPNLALYAGRLPAGWCPTGANALQQIYDLFFSLGYALQPDGAGFSINVTECGSDPLPDATQEGNTIWIPKSGGLPMGWYVFSGGWFMPATQGMWPDKERRIFVGEEQEVWAFDGGDGNDPVAHPPTITTGAMWEVDHNFDFRFLLGAGTSPGGTVVGVGDTGGTETHTLASTEMPAHYHCIVNETDGGSGYGYVPSAPDDVIMRASQKPGGEHEYKLVADSDKSKTATTGATSIVGGSGGSTVAHSIMPPYRGVFIIKRTIRRYYQSPCNA